MRLGPYLDSFRDELEKISSLRGGALVGAMLGAGLMPKKYMGKGALVGAGLGGLVGGAASAAHRFLEPSANQMAMAQQEAPSPPGYVPTWMGQGGGNYR